MSTSSTLLRHSLCEVNSSIPCFDGFENFNLIINNY